VHELLESFRPLLPGLGTILLAILSGAGGSALLELYYKPRRDRRKAATLLAAEIGLNAELIQLQAQLRKTKPRQIGRDFSLSTAAWTASLGVVAELPPHLVKKLLVHYARVDNINESVTLYAEAVTELEALAGDSPRAGKLKVYINSIIDVFNTGLNSAFDDAKALLPDLIKVAKIPSKYRKESTTDYEASVRQLVAEREQRLRALAAMDKPGL
jgi:hypothetical protein